MKIIKVPKYKILNEGKELGAGVNLKEISINERLLSINGNNARDDSTDSLKELSSISMRKRWFEQNCSILNEDIWDLGYCYIERMSDKKRNILLTKTYEILSDEWFDDICFLTDDEEIHTFKEKLPISVIKHSNSGQAWPITSNFYNFLSLKTGKLISPNIWFNSYIYFSFQKLNHAYYDNLHPEVKNVIDPETYINKVLFYTSFSDRIMLLIDENGNFYRTIPSVNETIKIQSVPIEDVVKIIKNHKIDQPTSLNEKLLSIRSTTVDNNKDNLFNIQNLEKEKPKIIKWLLNYGVNINKITIDIYNGKPGIYVNGDLNMSGKGITFLPYKFVQVKGSFNISNNKLTSCKNLPDSVGGKLNINKNFIKSFEDLPTTHIGFSIEADHQKCKTLYPLTDENARIRIEKGSDESLRKNRVKVEINEEFQYGTIIDIDRTESMAKVVLDESNNIVVLSTADVYPLEKDLI